MRLPAKSAVLAAALAVGACSGPGTIDYAGRHAQRVVPSNSMLGEACDGHDPSLSLRMGGHTYLTADFAVSEIVGGLERPWRTLSAPVTKGISQVAHPVFSGAPGPEACGGAAARTVVRRENGAVYVDWVLEVAPEASGTDVRPADPWRVVGRTPVDGSGYASDTVAFRMDGRPMVARLRLAPGAAWIAEQNRARAAEFEAAHPSPHVGGALPDERPGLTLDDVTNPAFSR